MCILWQSAFLTEIELQQLRCHQLNNCANLKRKSKIYEDFLTLSPILVTLGKKIMHFLYSSQNEIYDFFIFYSSLKYFICIFVARLWTWTKLKIALNDIVLDFLSN